MAGGPITVTDRISVRVSAKTQEQSAANKKAVGGAIGKTLGNEDISDELKTQLGNTKNPVVYDEDGNAWISMEDIIAAGKKMNGDGAFPDKYKYGNIAAVALTSLPEYMLSFYGSDNDPKVYVIGTNSEGPVCVPIDYDNQAIGGIRDINTGNIHILTDPQGRSAWITAPSFDGNRIISWTAGVNDGNISYSIPITDVGQVLLSLPAYGDKTVIPGSIIDWTKTDEEIARDIQELHDTWDISEHPGGATRIDYVLAGAIEFNPGDPTQGPPGSVG